MKLIDTNVVIDHLSGNSKASKYLGKQKDDKIIFSALTETELISGEVCKSRKRRQQIQQLLQKWEKVPVNNPIALKAGNLRREENIETPDSIIAATALKNNATLVTRNTQDFREIEELEVEEPYG